MATHIFALLLCADNYFFPFCFTFHRASFFVRRFLCHFRFFFFRFVCVVNTPVLLFYVNISYKSVLSQTRWISTPLNLLQFIVFCTIRARSHNAKIYRFFWEQICVHFKVSATVCAFEDFICCHDESTQQDAYNKINWISIKRKKK